MKNRFGARRRAFALAAMIMAIALPASGEQGVMFSGVRDGGWGLWHLSDAGAFREIHKGEVRGAVARAGWLAFADPAGTIHAGPTDGDLSIISDLPIPCGQPTLSPNGQTLVVACFRFANRQDDGALFSVALPSGAVTPLFDGPGLQKSPAFSPDGRQIAFVSGFRLNAERVIEHIWVMDADGQNARALADVSDVNIDVDWRDAQTLAFASDQGTAGVQIWSLNIETGAAEPLTDGPADMETAVAPDGRIAFVGLDGDNFRLMLRDPENPATPQAIVVTPSDGFEAAHDPFWTMEY